MTILEAAAALRAKKVSAVELVNESLARIARVNPKLNAFITVTGEAARVRAAELDAELAKGIDRGPLHGVPIALKDIIYTSFAPTTGGGVVHKNFVPGFNATVVDRLDASGAITLGKLKTTEHAFAEHHPTVTPPRNPWNVEYWSGASSSGSGVAPAAGLAFGTLGSDTGGSIRFPSAANGVTGLKPTYGRVSRYGVFPLSASLDHIGPITRTALDAAIMLGAIAGWDPNDATALHDAVPDYASLCSSGIIGLKIGIPVEHVQAGVADPVIATIKQTQNVLGSMGAIVKEIKLPSIDDVLAGWTAICSVDTALAHEATYPSQASQYGPVLAGFIETGRNTTARELALSQQARTEFTNRLAAVFQEVDLLLIPAMPTTVLTRAQWKAMPASELAPFLRFTAPYDMTGNPTITLCGGFDSKGLPLAFQFVARHLSEGLLCQAGAAFQRATDWHVRHPD